MEGSLDHRGAHLTAVTCKVFFVNIIIFKDSDLSPQGFVKLPLTDERASHITKVLHKTVGDSFKAGRLNKSMGEAVITSTDESFLTALYKSSINPLPAFNPVSLIMGSARPVQLRRILRDVVALGIRDFYIVKTDTSEASYIDSSILDSSNMEGLLAAAAMQTGLPLVPKYSLYKSLDECLAVLKKEGSFESCSKVAFDNGGGSVPFSSLKIKASALVAIGSERGWSKRERALLQSEGFPLAIIGARVLRSETAVTVGLTLVENKLGVI